MLKPAHIDAGLARTIAEGVRKRRANPEADLQRHIVQVLHAILPKGSIVHHSANSVAAGGSRAHWQQGLLAGMGVHKGFADLIVLSEGRVLFLEVKSAKGALEPEQGAFRDTVLAQGHAWALVRSVDDALAALRDNGFRSSLRVRP